MALIQDHVQPGDLITATWMNALVDTLSDLRMRVADLEGNQANAVAITDLVFTNPLRLGAHLEIQGRNFLYTQGAQVVRMDGIDLTEFRGGSGDTRLLVTVPALPNVPETGRNVTLFVGNGITSVTRTVHVLPADRPVSGNLVDVLWETIAPNPVRAQVGTGLQPLRIGYRLRSRVGQPRAFTISPVSSRAELQSGIQVRDQDDVVRSDRQISLAALEERLFFIQIPNIPSSFTAGTRFTITVTAVSAGVTGSDTREFEVDAAVATPDPTITLSVSNFAAVDDAGDPLPAAEGSYEASSNTIRLRNGNFGRMELGATFEQTGIYDVTLTPAGTVAGWTRTLETGGIITIEQDDLDTNAGLASRIIRFSLNASGATASQIDLRVQRQGATADERLAFNLAPLA